MTASHPAAQLLQVLFEAAPDDSYLEVRPVPPGLLSKRLRFLPIRILRHDSFSHAVPTSLNGKANVFFGVLPRTRPSGRAADVALATCLWADLDRGLPDPWPATAPLLTCSPKTGPLAVRVPL